MDLKYFEWKARMAAPQRSLSDYYKAVKWPNDCPVRPVPVKAAPAKDA